MSARQRFVANGTAAPTQTGDGNGIDHVTSSTLLSDTAPDQHIIPPPLPLRDASNSPRPERGLTLDNDHKKKGGTTQNAGSPKTRASASLLAMTGTDRPLNIGNLVRPRTRKTGDVPSNENKKHRHSATDRLKENDSVSRILSPKPLPTSPLLQPVPSGQSDTTRSSHHQPMPLMFHESALGNVTGPVTAHTPTRRGSRIPVPKGDSFTASGLTLMNAFSSSDPRLLKELPASEKRHVLSMNRPLDPAHIRNSLSPNSPQHLTSNELTHDYQVPIATDESHFQEGSNFMQKQQIL